MDELVQWLRAQLDEGERTARRAADYDDGAAHDVHGPPGTWACMDEAEWFGPSYRGGVIAPRIGKVNAPELGAHIATHDPARVLREIDAKRQLLDELLPPPREPETDSELHARFAHPAYEYRTTEGPRKQWDDTDVPPVDEHGDPEPGWERNVDAGRDGWDRFDYTEESYWRRRLPEGQDRKPGAPRWLRLLAAPYADRPGYRDEWRP